MELKINSHNAEEVQTNNSLFLYLSLSHIHAHTHTTHQLSHLISVCLSLLHSSLFGIFILRVRQEGKEVLYLFFSSYTLINTRRSAQREISCQGTLQWISVLTQVIALLLWSLRVLILPRKVCAQLVIQRMALYLSSWFPILTGPCKWQLLHFPEGWLENRDTHFKNEEDPSLLGAEDKNVPRVLVLGEIPPPARAITTLYKSNLIK